MKMKMEMKEEENDKDEDEDEDEVVVYDIATFTIPVLSKPFSCQYVITPDFRDKATDMPSPFILPNKLIIICLLPLDYGKVN